MTRCQIARLLATSALVVAWAVSPSQWLLAAQDPASPTAAAGTPPAKAASTTAPAASDLPSQVDPNVQVLTQGSVHEAFGQPVLFNPGPNPVIANQPPAAVEELPPDTKPAGNNVEWIPGYWSFEAAQQRFVWTSGIWRVIPPGLAWVPGYWTKSGTGNQWVSGYWRRSETSIALASFGKQSLPSGPANPSLSNLPDIASSTVPGGPVSALNPANAAGTNPAAGAPDNREAFFDSQIRPVLLGTCAKCHGSTKPRNNLRLDSRAALLKGGDAGPAIVAGYPDKSLLIQAVRYTGEPKMPPNKKLSAAVIADFERWVRDGAIFPDNAPSVQPANSSGTPVAAVTPTPPGNTPTSADTPVAAASDATNLGAVPGPAASAASPAPAGAPVAAADDSPTLGAVPTSADAPATAAANPTGPGANPVSAAGPPATAASAAPTGANPATPNPAAGSATGPRFLPRPPASLESGPVGNPPNPNFTWIPGTWIFRHGRFLWLAGQWAPVHRGWVWVPARYVFTPAGYLFVDGYFDYELARRGVLFAPVIFRRGFVAPGFVFTPSVVLNTHRLTEFLFVNSPCGCYCFGDYFGASHVQAGIFPWFAFHMSSLGYDPFFAFASWAHHTDVGWHERLVSDFRAFRDDARLRPPRTFEDLERRGRTSGDRFESLAEPFSRFVTRTDPSSLRFERVTRDERGEIDRSLRRFREASSRRNEFETRFARHEPNREFNRDSRFADDRRDFRDDRRDGRDDRREFRDDRRDARDDRREFRDDRRESRVADDRRDSKFDDRRESRTGDDRTESRFRDDRRESRVGDERRDSRTADDGREGREQTTNRTPPVVSRRPVSTAGLGQHGIQEHPAQRLANPKFVPHPSNRGRSEPAIKDSSNGRR
jgi:Planctomycete cytochrome C/WXXGXW repeat (2 copies)